MKKPPHKVHTSRQKNRSHKRNWRKTDVEKPQLIDYSQPISPYGPFTLYQWPTSWPEQDQLPRIDPKINAERKEQLSKLLAMPVDIQKGIYPFKDIKLGCDDIEWLLVKSKPQYQVDWQGQVRRELLGLDLRGADLRGVDLRGISLANLRAGLHMNELPYITVEQLDIAGIHLEGANLNNAYLKEALLGGAHLDGTLLSNANLEGAYFDVAHLTGAHLDKANLKSAGFAGAHMERAHCYRSCLENAWLSGAYLQCANFGDANLERANLRVAHLEGANLAGTNLRGLS